MALIKPIAHAESLERVKAEIVKFLEIRLDADYQGNDAEGQYKGTNFDYQWTCGELMEVYVPSEGLTMEEIWEVVNYIDHYGYKDENGQPMYRGSLADWDGISIAKENVRRNKLYDADGTFKANDLASPNPISGEMHLELLQVVTEHMIPKRGEEEDYDAFYARCRRLTNAIVKKYNYTDCTVIGESLWGIAEHYCDIVKDVKVVCKKNGMSIVAYEYYC